MLCWLGVVREMKNEKLVFALRFETCMEVGLAWGVRWEVAVEGGRKSET